MSNFKKNLIAGLLSGALILTGGQAFAAHHQTPHGHSQAWQEETAQNIDGWAKYFSENYGVDAAQVEKAMKDGTHIEDIRQAAMLSKLSGKSFSDVLAMKVGWRQVAEKLGVTREQIKNFRTQERATQLATQANSDVKTVEALIKDGYDPHDIVIAGRIAKESNKNIKSVLDKRKINNTWDDVAKSFGVDMKKIMPPPPGHHGNRHGGGQTRN